MRQTLATEILTLARARGLIVTTAESCTGGLVAAALTDIAGSSEIFERGLVTYSNAAKRDLLGVAQDTLDRHGAVSEQVAAEMARGALDCARADLSVAVSGIAGPGGSEHKPEGRVCFALAGKTTAAVVETVEFGALGRTNVRAAAAEHALRLLRDALARLG
ncbi:CinA family protein [Salipiger aestuarii]|uniref:CinA family protein n=1 Tax=Salipiger aestuarii TaxID=568098 RepID=UPI00123AB2CA|nr:CinA family protein [Salipiger aestuarii]KAA8608792.1 damage-inducible protein CinA [Salipiger aestuarii]